MTTATITLPFRPARLLLHLFAVPAVLIVLLGGIELARYAWFATSVSAAADAGAQMAIQYAPTDAEVADTVTNVLLDRGVNTDYSVTIGTRQPDTPVNVRVEADIDLVVLRALFGDGVGLRRVASTSTMNHMP